MYAKLVPVDRARVSRRNDMMARARAAVEEVSSEIRTAVMSAGGAGGGQADVQYVIKGPDLDKLNEYSQKIVAKLQATPGVGDPDISMVFGKPELRVEIDRQRATDLGVKVTDIATALNTLVAGQVVSSFPSGGEAVRRPPARRQQISHQHRRPLAVDRVLHQQAGLGAARSSGSHQGRHRSFEHQPPGPPAPGHHQRQRAARRSRSSK